jgi:ABC-type lipoprotein release transport system permease subunit
VLGSDLLGVRPGEAVSLAAGALTLCAIALVASWIPANRAARTDPLSALREE